MRSRELLDMSSDPSHSLAMWQMVARTTPSLPGGLAAMPWNRQGLLPGTQGIPVTLLVDRAEEAYEEASRAQISETSILQS